MRSAFGVLFLLLTAPTIGGQAVPGAGPSPAGNAHFASDGQHALDEASLLADVRHGLVPQANHAITVALADHPLLDRTSIRLLYGVEGRDPAQGSAAPMSYAGTTATGDLWFTATLRPADLQGPLASPESLVRFLVKYRVGTEQTDQGPGAGYGYIRDGQGPTVQQLTLDGQTWRAASPGAPVTVRATLVDASIVSSASVDVVAEGYLHATANLVNAGANQWSTTLDTQNLPRGLYSLRIQGTDSAGNHQVVTFPDRLVVGSQNPGPIAGNAHTARDATRVLTQHHLAGPSQGGLQRTDAHDLTVLLDNGLPARALAVRLHYTTDGTAPTLSSPSVAMSQSAAAAAHNAFTATLTPQDRLGASPESEVRFIVAVASPYFPMRTDDNGGLGYRYVDDGAEPRFTGLHINGNPTFAGSSSEPVTVRVDAQDPSGLHEVRIQVVDGANVARQVSLTPVAGGAEATLASGWAIPRGTYSIDVEAQDLAGNAAQTRHADILHIGDGAPPAVDATASDGWRTLNADQLARSAPATLDGWNATQFRLRIAPPQRDEAVSVEVQYDLTGAVPTATSPRTSAARLEAGPNAWTYGTDLLPGALRGSAGPEHPVAFRFLVHSDLFGSRIEPETGAYHFTWDSESPRLAAPTFNGEAAIASRPTTPVTIAAGIQDAGGVAAARLQILDGPRILLDRAMTAAEAAHFLDLPAGLALPEGTFDARIVARDLVGHETLRVAPGAVRVDAAAPGLLSLTVNGATRLEVAPQVPLRIAAVLDSADAARVRAAFIDTQGVTVRDVEMAAHDATTWTTTLPQGPGLTTGGYHVRITVQDAAGNERQSTTLHPALIVDAAPPTIYTDRIEYALGTKQAARAGDTITIQVGVAEANTIRDVHVERPSGAVALTPVGGPFHRYTFEAPASTGPLAVAIAAVDAAGNRGVASLNVIVDNRPPSLSGVTASSSDGKDTVATGDDVHVTAIASDQSTSVRRVLLDATRANDVAQVVDLVHAPGSTTWTAAVQVLSGPGTYAMPLTAFDEAGNAATAMLRIIVRDEGPAITQVLLNGRDEAYTRPNVPVRVDAKVGATSAIGHVNVTLYGPAGAQELIQPLMAAGAGAYTGSIALTLPEGRHRAEVQAMDAQGRSVRYEDPVGRLVIDGTPPRLLDFTVDTGISDPDATTLRAFFGDTADLAAAIADLSPVNATVTVTLPDGSQVRVPLTDSTGSQTFLGSMDLQALGVHKLRLVARDAVGYTVESSRDLEVIAAGTDVPGAVRNLRTTGLPSQPGFAWDAPLNSSVAGYAVAIDGQPPSGVTTRGTAFQAPALAAGTHSMRVRAIGSQGNPGPLRELPFTVPTSPDGPQPLPSIQPNSGAAAALSTSTLSGQANGTPTLSWTATGPNVQCVQIQAQVNDGNFTDVEQCTTKNSTDRLAGLGAKAGDNVTVRGRLLFTDGSTGAWQNLAQYQAGSPPPPRPGNVRLAVQGNATATAAEALVYDANGSLVARIPLTALDGGFAANVDLPPGNYTVQYTVQDASGQEAKTQARLAVAADQADAARQGKQSVAEWLVGLGALLTLAVLALLYLRRKGKASNEAKPPDPAPPPPAQAPAAPARDAEPPAPPATEARGIESSGPGAARRVLAQQEHARVGEAGQIQLFGEGR